MFNTKSRGKLYTVYDVSDMLGVRPATLYMYMFGRPGDKAGGRGEKGVDYLLMSEHPELLEERRQTQLDSKGRPVKMLTERGVKMLKDWRLHLLEKRRKAAEKHAKAAAISNKIVRKVIDKEFSDE
jgi:hypothetical protein